jgi:hypothetical protein
MGAQRSAIIKHKLMEFVPTIPKTNVPKINAKEGMRVMQLTPLATGEKWEWESGTSKTYMASGSTAHLAEAGHKGTAVP